MKKLLVTFLLCAYGSVANAQISVEKSTFGVQTGLLGLWFHNEYGLSTKIALRSEFGISGGYGYSSYFGSVYTFLPEVSVEPRLYYNLEKRSNKSKRIDGNQGNFISLKTLYHPDWFLISSNKDASLISIIEIIPTWGIRRIAGNRFTYEAGIGIGYQHSFYKQAGHAHNAGDLAVNLHLRFGYKIK